MARFMFEFDGLAYVNEAGFFGYDFMQETGREITHEDIREVLDAVDAMDLLVDWNLSSCLEATLTDTKTGAIWSFDGYEWQMVQDRRLLPGEQRLFE